jgi:tRNA dimethylallyltransferase
MKIFIIAGATASGKTAAAVELAKLVDGEVISADSMQIYRGMDIGTAKPTEAEKQGIPHHLLDIADPDEQFSAALFQAKAREKIAEIFSRKKVPIIAGGTGFYINAVLYGAEFSAENERENLLREEFAALAREQGAEALHEKLAAADPTYAATIHANNVKRVARALAFVEATGLLFSSHNAEQKNCRTPQFDATFCVLDVPRKVLYSRINTRTHAMLEAGLVEEVKILLAKNYNKTLATMLGIGYKEIVQFLHGEISLEEATAAIQQSTRRYAKRQETWFRNQTPEAARIFADGKTAQQIAEEIMKASDLDGIKLPRPTAECGS